MKWRCTWCHADSRKPAKNELVICSKCGTAGCEPDPYRWWTVRAWYEKRQSNLPTNIQSLVFGVKLGPLSLNWWRDPHYGLMLDVCWLNRQI